MEGNNIGGKSETSQQESTTHAADDPSIAHPRFPHTPTQRLRQEIGLRLRPGARGPARLRLGLLLLLLH